MEGGRDAVKRWLGDFEGANGKKAVVTRE